jgi:pilus assembly protein Flp/PilA
LTLWTYSGRFFIAGKGGGSGTFGLIKPCFGWLTPSVPHFTLGGTSPALTRWGKYAEARMIFIPVERGQGMVEYALLIVMIALVAIVMLTVVGKMVSSMFSAAVASWQLQAGG